MNGPIIAVFGSHCPADTEKTMARELGSAVVKKSGILLTGGDPYSVMQNTGLVKDLAIIGAKNEIARTQRGAWIGVGRSGQPGAVDPSVSGRCCWLFPGFEHKRNYIEACLCDAAIGIHGGAGTLSEVAFCLSLRKPVVLLGNGWMQGWPLGQASFEEAFKGGANKPPGAVESISERMKKLEPGASPWEPSLKFEDLKEKLTSLPPHSYLPPSTMPEKIVEVAWRLASEAPKSRDPSGFPPYQKDNSKGNEVNEQRKQVYDEAICLYEKWLSTMRAKLEAERQADEVAQARRPEIGESGGV